MSTVPVPPSLEHTLDIVNSGRVKIKTMKLVELKDLCGYYHEVIQDLGRKLEDKKTRNSVETSVKANDIRAELKELKDLVLVNVDGFNAKGDKPTGSLSQTNWDTSDRSVPWDVINRVVEADALSSSLGRDGDCDNDGAILRTQASEAKTLGDYMEAFMQSQAATQAADLAKGVQQRATQKLQKVAQEAELEEREQGL
jgi:hypothetical protein